jgi:hypothetical protein
VGAPAAGEADELAADVRRLADRLRSLSDVRLARPLPPSGSRADAARAVAQLLADGAARLTGDRSRPVPRLHDFAVGDQVAVTGADLVAAARAAGGLVAEGVAEMLAEVLAEARQACRQLLASL